jgi:translation initiation factor IF-2
LAKNLKLNIKNEQLAQAVNLGNIKGKLAKKGSSSDASQAPSANAKNADASSSESQPKEEAPRIKARSRSAFAEPAASTSATPPVENLKAETGTPLRKENFLQAEADADTARPKSNAELRRQIFGDEMDMSSGPMTPEPLPNAQYKPKPTPTPPPAQAQEEEPKAEAAVQKEEPVKAPQEEPKRPIERQAERPPRSEYTPQHHASTHSHPRPPQRYQDGPKHNAPFPQTESQKQDNIRYSESRRPAGPYEKLGPTGRHVKDLVPPPRPRTPRPGQDSRPPRQGDDRGPPRGPMGPRPQAPQAGAGAPPAQDKERRRPRAKDDTTTMSIAFRDADEAGKVAKGPKAKEFRDVKPARKLPDVQRSFDARDRHGLRADEEGQGWRKKKAKGRKLIEDTTQRPTTLVVRLPITVKDLASDMKLKASQLIAKLFMQGVAVTLNDLLEDETTIQLLGQEFGCEITVDRREEERIRITDKSIRDEIAERQEGETLLTRAPIVAFMGHVDHGKTSLIDAIRKSNRVAGEAGAITQHIGAFRCSTAVGDIAILDTPGHEAFSAMRARGADVTDIVVLVVAGDEGIRQQTIEAIQHAKTAGVTIVVAINKSDKPNYNTETVYRQLAEQNLLPEAWGGQTITINCSAVTGEGINALLEMLALQAEVLELKAIPEMRARGTVLESELHKGMGNVTTVLVQNGTLHRGDAVVFSQHWGRVKTMRNEFGKELETAGPSTPVEITGLSGLPDAGEEFIVVKSEKEAREIAEARSQGLTQKRMQQGRKMTMESMLLKSSEAGKKILNLIVRADVQGSLEALRTALEKIHSDKVDLNIIMSGVGEISESDVLMADTSKAAILGFHTQIEAHAEALIKQYGIRVYLHDIIYHAIDQAKELMTGMLDKIAEENEKGQVEVKAIFKSSQHGVIAGCQVSEGSIHRSNLVRLRRGKDIIWKGTISSLRRGKDDVREVQKGFECGVVLNGYNDAQEGDVIESYEMIYKLQEL